MKGNESSRAALRKRNGVLQFLCIRRTGLEIEDLSAGIVLRFATAGDRDREGRDSDLGNGAAIATWLTSPPLLRRFRQQLVLDQRSDRDLLAVHVHCIHGPMSNLHTSESLCRCCCSFSSVPASSAREASYLLQRHTFSSRDA